MKKLLMFVCVFVLLGTMHLSSQVHPPTYKFEVEKYKSYSSDYECIRDLQMLSYYAEYKYDYIDFWSDREFSMEEVIDDLWDRFSIKHKKPRAFLKPAEIWLIELEESVIVDNPSFELRLLNIYSFCFFIYGFY
jgi:hypothetical protein